MIDIKKFLKLNRLTIVLCILFILLIVMPITYSKFQSIVNPKVNVMSAFYLLNTDYQTQTIKLSDLVPSNSNYTFAFSVSNYKDNDRCEVDMEYEIIVTTTTNLPLSFSLSYADSNSNIIASNNIIQDDDGMYLNEIKTNKVTFNHNSSEKKDYILTVSFPSIYTDIMYQDIIEGIIISVDSKQIIDE